MHRLKNLLSKLNDQVIHTLGRIQRTLAGGGTVLPDPPRAVGPGGNWGSSNSLPSRSRPAFSRSYSDRPLRPAVGPPPNAGPPPPAGLPTAGPPAVTPPRPPPPAALREIFIEATSPYCKVSINCCNRLDFRSINLEHYAYKTLSHASYSPNKSIVAVLQIKK